MNDGDFFVPLLYMFAKRIFMKSFSTHFTKFVTSNLDEFNLKSISTLFTTTPYSLVFQTDILKIHKRLCDHMVTHEPKYSNQIIELGKTGNEFHAEKIHPFKFYEKYWKFKVNARLDDIKIIGNLNDREKHLVNAYENIFQNIK